MFRRNHTPKKGDTVAFTLHRYQVDVYNSTSELIDTIVAEGFEAIEAIRNARHTVRIKARNEPSFRPKISYPLRFITTIK